MYVQVQIKWSQGKSLVESSAPHSAVISRRRGTRLAILLLILLLPEFRSRAQEVSSTTQVGLYDGLEITTLRLWPDRAPGAKGEKPSDNPTLTVFRPSHSSGTAVIVAPGGAYISLASNLEGRQAADRLAELGITTFVLSYRLGPAYLYPVPLQDARRAVQVVRSLASVYGYAPNRIGMMGFSAGGHLTAMAATLFEPSNAEAADPVEHESSALNFQILVYPWLNAMEPPLPSPSEPGKILINYCSVTPGLTQSDCRRLNGEFTPKNYVRGTTPPAFIVASTDDAVVPVSASIAFYDAMHAAGADAELHLFAHGPHGFGTGGPDPSLSQWPELLTTWLRTRGLLTPLTQ